MKKINCLFITLLTLTIIFSCTESEKQIATKTNDSVISSRNADDAIETEEFTKDGLIYPAGTTIRSVGDYTINIELPEGYEFIYINAQGEMARSTDKCYECECSEKGGGCNVEFQICCGYGCYHSEDCTATCSGKHVECDEDAAAVQLMAIHQVSAGINFFQEGEDPNAQNQPIINSEETHQKYDETVDGILEALFHESYINDPAPEIDLIPISFFDNLIAIKVKSTWRSHAKKSYDQDLYSVANAKGIDDVVSCKCVFKNPFDVRPGNCFPSFFESIVCINECVESCRMRVTIKDGKN